MSHRCLLLVSEKLPYGGTEMNLMQHFAAIANDDGEGIWHSIETMSGYMRRSMPQTRRALHKLVKDGWVLVSGAVNGGAPGTTPNYKINVDKLEGAPYANEVIEKVIARRKASGKYHMPRRNRHQSTPIADDTPPASDTPSTPPVDDTPPMGDHGGLSPAQGVPLSPMRETPPMDESQDNYRYNYQDTTTELKTKSSCAAPETGTPPPVPSPEPKPEPEPKPLPEKALAKPQEPIRAKGDTSPVVLTIPLVTRAVARAFQAQHLLSGEPFSPRRYFRVLLGRSGT